MTMIYVLNKLNNVNLFESNVYDESNFRDCNGAVNFLWEYELKGY